MSESEREKFVAEYEDARQEFAEKPMTLEQHAADHTAWLVERKLSLRSNGRGAILRGEDDELQISHCACWAKGYGCE